ncbi:hypothetical protein ACIRL2_41255 [Embleya sp. NPDC127516]|uniref:hypothetical protein n=1 Tax=Embleya sp. NPDC127516 TaxID=3363990 RepID=UPI00382AA082
MTARKTRQESGEAVLATIKDHPDGIRRVDMAQDSDLDLTPGQIGNGVVWVREVGAAREGLPFTSTRGIGYRFSDDPDEWAVYERQEMRRCLTTLIRLTRGTLDPHLQRAPQDTFARMLSSQLTGMISTFEYVLAPEPTPPHLTHTPA